MTNHNDMRKKLVKMISDVQTYSFGSVISNIEYKETLSYAGLLISRIFHILSDERLQNYTVFSHDDIFESSYDYLVKEVDLFISKIKMSSNSVTENGFVDWDTNSNKIFEMFKFPEQNSTEKESEELTEYE
jgi:hypothetical protein